MGERYFPQESLYEVDVRETSRSSTRKLETSKIRNEDHITCQDVRATAYLRHMYGLLQRAQHSTLNSNEVNAERSERGSKPDLSRINEGPPWVCLSSSLNQNSVGTFSPFIVGVMTHV